MSNLREETVNTYNRSAKTLAEYFRGIGSRVADIDRAFGLAGNPKDAKVAEIGCGDGRDAQEIIKRTPNYIGMDISEGLIKLARQLVPTARFEIGDASTYHYPDNLDVVFAFASLLHLNKDEVKLVLSSVHKSLKPGGIFYISLKYAAEYAEKIKRDQYGERLFFFYSPELIEELAGMRYQTVFSDRQTIGNTEWFTIALKKM